MYYIGLDVHKKTISYCVKDAAGKIHREGKIGSTRRELDAWIKTLPQPRMMAMEATIFTGWIYDHLLPHAEKVKVAHQLMLRAIAPVMVKQAVKIKNRIWGLLMETGVSYNKRRLHKVGYFDELMSGNEEIDASIRPLLKLSRETINRSQKLDYALVSSLERDPLLKERLERLKTVPGVGPITALTWVLEIGDVARFRSVKQAISYCGLCGAEKSSADKVLRTPLSKQRNKHIQHVLVEAAKLAPRQSHELALIREREMQKGNRNRATLAVARKMVAYLLAVDRRQREFVPAEVRSTAAA